MAYENDNIEIENLPLTKYQGQKTLENNIVNDSLMNDIVDDVQNVTEEKIENDYLKNSNQNLEINNLESTIQHSSNNSLINIPIQVCIFIKCMMFN